MFNVSDILSEHNVNIYIIINSMTKKKEYDQLLSKDFWL